jgi:CRISPR-associated endoribonuclease Cas6
LKDLSYSKVDVIINAKKPQTFIGSMIRGAFGHSLKKVVCINPKFKCDDCFAIDSCIYYDFFEQKNTYHKYRIDYILEDELFRFSIYLYENRAKSLPYIISALSMMLEKNGLGRDRITYKDFNFYVNDMEVYDAKKFKPIKNFIKQFRVDKTCPKIILQFQTPLRIKKNNSLMGIKEFDLIYLINSIYQRYLKLIGEELSKLNFEPKFDIKKQNLHWKKLTRFSNRQKTKMNMDGLVGEIKISNLDENSYKILKLGEIIGAGKQTVMGLGKIYIKDSNERD